VGDDGDAAVDAVCLGEGFDRPADAGAEVGERLGARRVGVAVGGPPRVALADELALKAPKPRSRHAGS
jgi:hypothetical protein